MFEAQRRIHAVVVAAWLAGIIVNLPILGDFNGVALRDIGLLFGTLALCQLAGLARPTQTERH